MYGRREYERLWMIVKVDELGSRLDEKAHIVILAASSLIENKIIKIQKYSK